MLFLFLYILSTLSLRLTSNEDSYLKHSENVTKSFFLPPQGKGGTLKTEGFNLDYICQETRYTSSPLETLFRKNINSWAQTAEPDEVCAHLGYKSTAWIKQNMEETEPSADIFSTLCRKGEAPQLIEPLAGLLRDPRFLCSSDSPALKFSIDWLTFADTHVLDNGRLNGKKLFFDAGGSRFLDGTQFFVSHYEKRGIVFDHVYVWEAKKGTPEKYWKNVDPATRAKWEPRLTFYNGIPVSAEQGHKDNVVERIYELCNENDFCGFKLDIDTPSVELPLVQQLLAQPSNTTIALNEFFFEHHVHGTMQYHGWGDNVASTFADSITIFTQLRQLGVRSHSWI